MVPSADDLPSLEPLPVLDPAPKPVRTVLLVEDEESLADLLAHLLERLQLDVVRAADGATALQRFEEHRSRIVLAFVDCRLPDMDGASVCQQLRQLHPRLPLLLTSGRDQRSLVATFSATGPTGFLAKPYMPADVMHHVNTLLGAAD